MFELKRFIGQVSQSSGQSFWGERHDFRDSLRYLNKKIRLSLTS